jgi:hypothetical protein
MGLIETHQQISGRVDSSIFHLPHKTERGDDKEEAPLSTFLLFLQHSMQRLSFYGY